MEKQYPEQIRRGKALLAQRDEERKKYPETTSEPLAVRDKPKP
jgi:hypothetical protein